MTTLLSLSRFVLITALCAIFSRSLGRAQEIVYAEAEVSRAEKAYANEPTIEEVLRSSLKTGSGARRAVEQIVDRARASGWVPTVRLGVRRGIGAGLSAYQTIETDRTSFSSDDNLVLEATLTFHLDKLVFDPVEVTVAREKTALDKAIAERIRTIVALYYERRKLQLERDLSGQIDPKSAARIGEIEALLNVFTNGEFERMIGKKRSAAK
jgi:hypothetical protein